MRTLFFLATAAVINWANSQTQTVRGTLYDRESQQVIEGAAVLIYSGPDSGKISITNGHGEFKLDSVQLGRINLIVIKKEYQDQILNNIIITSGKEVILRIELEGAIIDLGEAVISVKGKQKNVNNENALVSARLFTVDETDRFAGSRGDPARMASNFAGVQGADDSRNDIVVRGNSPQGVLWRLEGIDIPNPNHFAIAGTTGGPLSIINNKILGNSDFFTGAFPAEYGNSTAGAFDLKMRAGNNKKREYSTQFGLFGWDLMAEGPFSKKSKSSFLATYRYSTLAIFGMMNINLGTSAIPKYQDASFKLNFPIGTKGNLSFFGIGGTSKIDILISNQTESSSELYGDDDRDQYFSSRMGVTGSVFTWKLNKKSYFNAAVAVSHQNIKSHHELVYRHATDSFIRDGKTAYRFKLDSLIDNLDYKFRTNTVGTNLFVNTKFNNRTSMRYGMQITQYFYSFHDSGRNFDYADTGVNGKYWKWFTRWNSEGTGLLIQPYVQFKWRASPKLSFSTGVTSQIFAISDKNSGDKNTSVEAIQPRLGMRYQLNPKRSLNFGAGFHSQIQPGYTYYYILPGNTKPHNLNMGMTRSQHLVLGFDQIIGRDKHVKIETYYQNLTNIPVTIRSSSFSLANTGSGFSRFFPDSLKNTGTGRNYGVEFTFEKSFTKGYFYMFTLSIFDAKYTGSDGVERNSDFNTNYALNGLFAKEWKIKKRGILNLGGKLTMAGARRFSPIDLEKSKREREYVEIDALKNTERFGSPYQRLDMRISYKINSKKVTHEIAFDFINLTNNQNVLKYSYISEAPYYRQEYQLGFLPVFYYKIDF